MRQIVLDTETTGLSIADGNRIVEIGAIEIINRKITGEHFHVYVNPDRDSEEGALAVHGITTEFLKDKPPFSSIAADFMAFIKDAELIIHNAPFDIGFLNHELHLLNQQWGKITDYCKVTDSLLMAKNIYPGQRASLDALCKRLEVDNSGRDFHGALLDAELLAYVYLQMTGGQRGLEWDGSGSDASGNANAEPTQQSIAYHLPIITASADEIEAHKAYLTMLEKKSNGECLWIKA